MISLRDAARRENARGGGSLALSVVLHIALGAAILQALLHPYQFPGKSARSDAVRAERIGFLRLPTSVAKSAATPAVPGGDGREGRAQRVVPRLVAPLIVPTGIPAPQVTALPKSEGSGPLVAGGGPVRGITPSYSDPRLWQSPQAIPTAPKTASQRLDSVIVAALQPYVDSVASRSGDREPGDWTFEKNGQKYGIDRKFIRLGPVSIPTALLAMLPLNVQGNPTQAEREKTLSALNRDITYHANRGMNEVDFKKAVRSIRERKERERATVQAAAMDANKKDRPAN